jgi:CP family cyanate transporter-like MFS transporter
MIMASPPFAFIVPVMAGRMSNQRLLVVITTILFLIGTLGLLYSSIHLLQLWVIIFGSGAGFAFGLSTMFFGLRTQSAHQAAELSGMAQSIGYLLAAIGLALIGYLLDASHSWNPPLLILVGASALLDIVGLGAARNQFVGSDKDCLDHDSSSHN